jgi:hypothetical protein
VYSEWQPKLRHGFKEILELSTTCSLQGLDSRVLECVFTRNAGSRVFTWTAKRVNVDFLIYI